MQANTVVPTEDRRPRTELARVGAILEVLVAFVLVHAGFRAFKRFTELGRLEGAAHLNFSPGAVMTLFTVSILLLLGRDFATYGLRQSELGHALKTGLCWGSLLVAGAGLLKLLGVQHQPGVKPPTMAEGIIYAVACLAAVILFCWLLTHQPGISSRVPTFAGWLVLIGVMGLPLLVAWQYRRPVAHTLLTVLWLAFGAGCGEEIFYRGYIQSRLNEAFGRPFRFKGLQFGVGLLVSSLLFGFLHALNSVDYFQGRFTFAWGFGIAAIFAGLLYGCLRESTGGVWAGAVTHATLDVLVMVPGLISGT